MRGSNPILERLREEFGLKDGAITTDDGEFTVETVACLGACGLAPVLTVDGEVHASMTPDKVTELANELKERAGVAK